MPLAGHIWLLVKVGVCRGSPPPALRHSMSQNLGYGTKAKRTCDILCRGNTPGACYMPFTFDSHPFWTIASLARTFLAESTYSPD